MTPEGQQTADLVSFLRRSCPVCLVPCDPEIHAATLRLKEPPFQPAYGPPMRTPHPGAAVKTTVKTCKCGVRFETLNPRLARRCPECAAKASAEGQARRNRARRRKIVTD